MITREADYAIRALVLLIDCEEKNSTITTLTLSEEMDIPYRFLRKILKKLRDNGFIETKKGKAGGIRLKKGKTDISVLDVLHSVARNSVELNSCLSRDNGCKRTDSCKLHTALGTLQNHIDTYLKDLTLDKLI
ncbi:MAG TPA: Rrf2 family transcriptional regulator [Victivallales bacterium]|nr:Rrf2 family transcriptional regulator [Victivallales bacterium]